jgi:hypothetical protein
MSRIVYSTRWFDDTANQADRPNKIAIEVVIQARRDNKRLAALSRRTSLAKFLKSGEIRSHAGASL